MQADKSLEAKLRAEINIKLAKKIDERNKILDELDRHNTNLKGIDEDMCAARTELATIAE